jgi:hypothetical protein
MALCMVVLFAGPAKAQSRVSGDVATIDGIISAVYESVSGPAGQARDWERFRRLHAPDARLVRTWTDQAGQVHNQVMSLDGFISAVGTTPPEQPFYEREIGRRELRFGHIAHVWTTFASYRDPETEPFTRGINSMQLVHDGTRWWIHSITWDYERDDNRLPPSAIDR